MKRSETVLVYGVTGVLAAVLLVAVIFGNEAPEALAQEKVAASDPVSLDDLLSSELPVEDSQPAEPEVLPPAEEEAPSVDDAAGGAEGATPTTVPLEMAPPPTVASVFGESRRVQDYRIVTVRTGQTLSQIVQDWCGSLSRMDDVIAMNEELDPARLAPGTEVWLPWREDQEILDAWLARDTVTPSYSPSAPVADPVVSTPVATPAAASGAPAVANYTIKEGDSLWVIAQKRVGARGAKGYIDEILAANPSIRDASLIRVGMKIRLP